MCYQKVIRVRIMRDAAREALCNRSGDIRAHMDRTEVVPRAAIMDRYILGLGPDQYVLGIKAPDPW